MSDTALAAASKTPARGDRDTRQHPAGDNDELQVETIEDLDAFEAIREDWTRLYRDDPDAHYFLSWHWLSQVFASHPGQWRVLGVRTAADGQWLAFIPLRIRTYWSRSQQRFCNEVRMAGTFHWADYTGLLCDPTHESTAIPALARQLKTLPWRDLVLKNLRISAHRHSLLTGAFHPSVFRHDYRTRISKTDQTNLLVCPHVELDKDFDSFLTNRISSNTRQKIRRFLRKVEQDDELRITVSNEQTREQDLDVLSTLWRRKWEKRKGDDADRLTRTYRAIVQQGLKAGSVFMPILWRGDNPLGVLCSFVDRERKELLFYVTGRSEQGNNPPPGLVLHAYSIRWAIEQGLTAYDFLRGDEAYKYSLGARDREILYLTLSPRSGFSTSTALDTLSTEFVLGACERYLRKDKVNRAETGYRQILQIEPENVAALRGLAQLLYVEQRLGDAKAIYRNLTHSAPDDLAAWRRLGALSLKLNDFETAAQALQRTIDLAKRETVIDHYRLGCALYGLGRDDEAAAIMDTAGAISAEGSAERRVQRDIAAGFR